MKRQDRFVIQEIKEIDERLEIIRKEKAFLVEPLQKESTRLHRRKSLLKFRYLKEM